MKPPLNKNQKVIDQSSHPDDEPEVTAFLAYEQAISMLQEKFEQKPTNCLHKLAQPNPKNK